MQVGDEGLGRRRMACALGKVRGLPPQDSVYEGVVKYDLRRVRVRERAAGTQNQDTGSGTQEFPFRHHLPHLLGLALLPSIYALPLPLPTHWEASSSSREGGGLPHQGKSGRCCLALSSLGANICSLSLFLAT